MIMGLTLEEAVPYLTAAALVLITILFLMSSGGSKKFLDPKTAKERKKVKCIKRTMISHDTVNLRFALPSPNMVMGLPIGHCIKIFCPNMAGSKKGEWNGRPDDEDGESEIERKYTPVPNPNPTDKGFFEMVIKVYSPGKPAQFPDGGKMSQWFGKMQVGDEMEFQGPLGHITYLGKGKFQNGKKEMPVKKIGMMAGGSGITPMLQVVDAVLNDKSDPTHVSLIYANKTEEDILTRDMLDKLAAEHPTRFHLHYTLDNPPKGWTGSKGFITEAMIAEHLPAAGPETVTLLCGPPGMIKFACKPNLEKLGHKSNTVLMF